MKREQNIFQPMDSKDSTKQPLKQSPAYSPESYPPMPTKFTLFFRRCIIYQLWRMLVLNIKILRIVVGGHS
jgi:hypothetical protein